VRCTDNSQCTSGLCSGGACCASTCKGTCQAGTCDGSGACNLQPARTLCGTIPGSIPGVNDVYKTCTASGACTTPKVFCGASYPSCQLDETHACCDHGTNQYGESCGNPSDCLGSGTGLQGESCAGDLDCPTGLLCCRAGIDNLWRICLARCDIDTCKSQTQNVPFDCQQVDHSCNPAMPICPAGQQCQGMLCY
jgi:hypothetical protein